MTKTKIPVGREAGRAFDWLTLHASNFFDALATGLEGLIDGVQWVLLTPHPFVIILAFAALAHFLQRSWPTTLGVVAGFLFIINQGYWEETMESLTLVLTSCVFCMGIGVPIGIALAHRPRLYEWVRPLLDLMQTLPTYVYLIPVIVFFGVGMVAGLIATVVFVLPAPIRLTQLGICPPRAH